MRAALSSDTPTWNGVVPAVTTSKAPLRTGPVHAPYPSVKLIAFPSPMSIEESFVKKNCGGEDACAHSATDTERFAEFERVKVYDVGVWGMRVVRESSASCWRCWARAKEAWRSNRSEVGSVVKGFISSAKPVARSLKSRLHHLAAFRPLAYLTVPLDSSNIVETVQPLTFTVLSRIKLDSSVFLKPRGRRPGSSPMARASSPCLSASYHPSLVSTLYGVIVSSCCKY